MIDHQSVKLFINGQLVAVTPFEGEIVHNNSPIFVGKVSGGSYPFRYFSGKIDDLRIYNRTLNESEVNFLSSVRR